MKLAEALNKCEENQTVSSEMCNMFEQNNSSLLHWLVLDKTARHEGTDIAIKQNILRRLLEADDWTIDSKESPTTSGAI